MQTKRFSWGLLSEYRREIMGVACLWILWHHNFCAWPSVLEPLRKLGNYGNAGVDIFLFLSGVGLYFAYQKKTKLTDFYKRRYVRLLIPYFLIATPYWIWLDFFVKKDGFWQDVTMLSFPLKGNVTTWYVAALAFFYLCYPLIYRLLFEEISLFGRKIKNNTLFLLFVAFWAGLCLVFKRVCPVFYDNIEIGMTRFIIFVIGCRAGKWVYEKRTLKTEYVWISVLFAVFYMAAFRTTTPISAYWIRMSYIPLSVSVILLLCGWFYKFGNKVLKKILAYFGDRSLEIYLSHVLLMLMYPYFFKEALLDAGRFLDYGVLLLLAIGISEVAHFIIGKLSATLLKNKEK